MLIGGFFVMQKIVINIEKARTLRFLDFILYQIFTNSREISTNFLNIYSGFDAIYVMTIRELLPVHYPVICHFPRNFCCIVLELYFVKFTNFYY